MIHKTDKPHVMQIIHRIDENAFISVSKTQGVYGRNFEKLKYWKEKKAPKYSVLLEGARRVGKSTIVEEFSRREYKSFVFIDWSKASKSLKDLFDF